MYRIRARHRLGGPTWGHCHRTAQANRTKPFSHFSVAIVRASGHFSQCWSFTQRSQRFFTTALGASDSLRALLALLDQPRAARNREWADQLWHSFSLVGRDHLQAHQATQPKATVTAHWDTLLQSQKVADPAHCRTRLIRLLVDMRDVGLSVTIDHYLLLLYVLCRASLMDEAVALCHDLRGQASDDQLLTMHNVLLYGFSRTRDFNGIINIYHQIFADQLTPNDLTFHLMIKAFQTEQDSYHVMQAFDTMVRHGVSPSLFLARNVIFYLVGHGLYAQALRVFDVFCQTQPSPTGPQVLHRDVYLSCALMYCALRTSQVPLARQLFDTMKSHARGDPAAVSVSEATSSHLESLSFNQFVQYFAARGRTDLAYELFSSLAAEGRCPDALTLLPLLRVYVLDRDFRRIRQLFQVLRDIHPRLDGSLAVALVRLYVHDEDLGAALEVPDALLNHRQVFSVTTYRAIVEGYVAARDFSGVIKVLRLMCQHHVLPDLALLELLMTFFLSNGHLALVKPLYFYMVDPSHFQRSSSVAQSSPSTEHSFSDLATEARSVQLKPTHRMYRKLIHQFAATQEMNTALTLLQDMVNFNLQPTEDIYIIVMHGCLGQHDPHAALDVFSVMIQQPIVEHASFTEDKVYVDTLRLQSAHLPDLSHLNQLSLDVFSVLIRAICNLGDVEEAERLTVSNTSSIRAYNQVMHAYISQRQPRAAQRVFQVMVNKGVQPDQYSYANLMRASRGPRGLQPIRDIFEDMIFRKVTPNATLFTNLIAAHVPHGDVDGAEWVLDVMKRQFSIEPDPIAYLTMLRVYRMASKPVRASRMWQTLLTMFPIQYDAVNRQIYPARYHLLAFSWYIRTFYPHRGLSAGSSQAAVAIAQLSAQIRAQYPDKAKLSRGAPMGPERVTAEPDYQQVLSSLVQQADVFSQAPPMADEWYDNGDRRDGHVLQATSGVTTSAFNGYPTSLSTRSPAHLYRYGLTLALPHLHHQLRQAWESLRLIGFPFTHLHYNDYFMALLYGFRIDEALDLIQGTHITLIGFREREDVDIQPEQMELELVLRDAQGHPTAAQKITADWSLESPAARPVEPMRATSVIDQMTQAVQHQSPRPLPSTASSSNSAAFPAAVTPAAPHPLSAATDGPEKAPSNARLRPIYPETWGPTSSASSIAADPTNATRYHPTTSAQPTVLYFYPVALESFFSVLKALQPKPHFQPSIERWLLRMFNEHRELFL
ncbi:hypothetical protein H4R34_002280 [Dimargaris verticillata]|uniref:Pentacotripeptide-repeat region of PRORP domain-containing protein n=1 Tax=Dimargaris verticillata TaxID=2761393 RepID=A0A9W8B230_9FUNG|nr:hypothetical protein H4R34_002280 [Dimargaris verticillata]